MFRKHEGRVFQVVGVDVKELERWGLSQAGNDLSLEGEPLMIWACHLSRLFIPHMRSAVV